MINAFEHPIEESERLSLLLHFSFLPSVHTSTEAYFKNLITSQTATDYEQLLLTYATFGRHSNIKDAVVDTLMKRLVKAVDLYSTHSVNSTSDIILLIHSLGNTGSNKIIPVLVPFIFNPDAELQISAIDALRTVSRNETVLSAFSEYVNDSVSDEQVIEVVKAVLFPFSMSLYFHESPDDPGQSQAEQVLMETLVGAAAKYQSTQLTNLVKTYLRNVNNNKAEALLEALEESSLVRRKRESTTVWNRRNALYDLIASHSSRSNDVRQYPYHKSYLWAKQLGVEKLHVKVALGGFAGVGSGGIKLFAKAVAEAYAWGYKYRAVEVEFSYETTRFHQLNAKKLAKFCGRTYVSSKQEKKVLPFSDRKTNLDLHSIRLFRKEFRFFIKVGFLNVYIEAHVNADLNIKVELKNMQAVAGFEVGPSIKVTGGASTKILVSYAYYY